MASLMANLGLCCLSFLFTALLLSSSSFTASYVRSVYAATPSSVESLKSVPQGSVSFIRTSAATPSSIESLLKSVLPQGSISVISTSNLSTNLFDVLETSDNINSLVSNLDSISASTTRIAAALFTLQTLQADLTKLKAILDEVKDLPGVALTDAFFALEEAVDNSIIQTSAVGKLLESVLKSNGGDTSILSSVEDHVNNLGSTLSVVSDGIHPMDILASAIALENFRIDAKQMLLFRNGVKVLDVNNGMATFKLVDDLRASTSSDNADGLTVAAVLQALSLQGGFNLPGDLGSGDITVGQEFFTEQKFGKLLDGNLAGVVTEGINLDAKFGIPGVVDEGLNISDKFTADGSMKLLKDGTLGATITNDLDFHNDLSLGDGITSSLGFGDRNVLSGSLDIPNFSGSLSNSNNIGGGGGFDSKLVDIGGGFGGNSDIDLSVNKGEGLLSIKDNISAGGGVGGVLGGDGAGGGLDGFGDFEVKSSLKDLNASLGLDREIGAGGVMDIGKNGQVGGGIGSTTDLDSSIDLKEMTSSLDFLTKSGADGNIKLPGNLGGLVYDIKGQSGITGYLDLKNLSNRALQVLSETDILVTLDLPGDKLDDVEIDLHPSIDLNIDNIGKLSVLRFAEEFALDVKAITDFNMISKDTLTDAIKSGIEFLARLEILDVLSGHIGSITALPAVGNHVRNVVSNMAQILQALDLVKSLSSDVRALGESLKNFDISELNIKLPELEALSLSNTLNSAEDAFDDMSSTATDALSVVTEAAENAIPNAANTLSSFNMGELMDAAEIAKDIAAATRENIAGFQDITDDLVGGVLGGNGLRGALNSPASFSQLLRTVPALTQGMSTIMSATQAADALGLKVGNGAEDVLNSIIKDTGVNNVVNGLGEQIKNVEQVVNGVVDLEALNLNAVIEAVTDVSGLQFDIGSIDQIVNLVGLDDALIADLAAILNIANLQDVDLLDIPDINDFDLTDIKVLSTLLGFDSPALFQEVLSLVQLDLSGLGLDGEGLNLAKIVELANVADIDLNRPDGIQQLLQMEAIDDIITNPEVQVPALTAILNAAHIKDVDVRSIVAALVDGSSGNSSGDGTLGSLAEVVKVVTSIDGFNGIMQDGVNSVNNALAGLDLGNLSTTISNNIDMENVTNGINNVMKNINVEDVVSGLTGSGNSGSGGGVGIAVGEIMGGAGSNINSDTVNKVVDGLKGGAEVLLSRFQGNAGRRRLRSN
eukprot:GHVQ01032880.1.p1 GENE.GHVQ01032880.1~~GHVQ01032880.1.p1  ORF type:complete len:1221 (+),score=228.10 GHVQ01032880.1:798-4460(+)